MTSESSVAGHTPGPWMAAAAPSSIVGWPVVGRMGRSICNVSWMPKKAYPDVSDADYAAFNAECEANARLIAAAPELLEFAKWVADRGGDNNCMDIFKRARSLIAKAEGGAA